MGILLLVISSHILWPISLDIGWYHLICVKLELGPQKWLCAACEASKMSDDDVIFPKIDMCLIT